MAKKTARKKMPKTARNVRKAAAKQAARTRVVTPKFDDNATIHILPAGKENPRRKGSPPYQRYEVLLKSRKVSDFLRKLPQWRSTIYRAIRENRVKIG